MKKLHYPPKSRERRRGITHAAAGYHDWIEPLYWYWKVEDRQKATIKYLHKIEADIDVDTVFDLRHYLSAGRKK